MSNSSFNFEPESINLSTLASVLFEERSQLPESSGVYFVVDDKGIVKYIGRAKNLNFRWIQHHRIPQLKAMDSIKIAYLVVDDLSLLKEIEKALIEWFNPELNNSAVATDKPKLSVYLEPKLKGVAEKAARKDGRSLSNWIRELIRRELGVKDDEEG